MKIKSQLMFWRRKISFFGNDTSNVHISVNFESIDLIFFVRFWKNWGFSLFDMELNFPLVDDWIIEI